MSKDDTGNELSMEEYFDKPEDEQELEKQPVEKVDSDQEQDSEKEVEETEEEGQPNIEDDSQTHDWEADYKNLQSMTDKRMNSVNAELKSLKEKMDSFGKEDVVTKEEKEELFDTEKFLETIPEDERQLFEENPSLLKVTAKMLGEMSKESKGLSKEDVAELIANDRAEQSKLSNDAEQDRNEQEAILKVVELDIPDVRDIISSDEFLSWRDKNALTVESIWKDSNDDKNLAVKRVIDYYNSSEKIRSTSATRKEAIKKSTTKTGKSQSSNRKLDDGNQKSVEEYFNEEQ